MYRTSYDSPLGKMYMSGDGKYLTGLWFEGSYLLGNTGRTLKMGNCLYLTRRKNGLIYISAGKIRDLRRNTSWRT